MKKLIYFAGLAILIYGFQACRNRSNDAASLAKDANKNMDTTVYSDTTRQIDTTSRMDTTAIAYNDSDFAVDAADAGMTEIQLGKIAVERSTNPDIKKFGQMIIDDHTKANNELKAIAKQKNITLPPSPGQENLEHIKMLNNEAGTDFNKDYIDMMVTDHEKVIHLFENASMDATDAAMKTFATNTLPTLRKHLEAAKSLQSKQ